MEPTQKNPDPSEQELSLKDFILEVQGWLRFLLSKWIPILVFGLIGGGLGLIIAFGNQVMYKAELTFVTEDPKSGAFSGYAGLASQFGLDLGSANSGGVFSGDNIMEFLKSRLMIEKTILSPISINGRERSMADVYIETNELKEKWKGKTHLKNISFPLDVPKEKFSRLQDSVLGILYERIVEKELTIDKLDKKLSFINVSFVSPNDYFAKTFTERLVFEATNFYIATKTKRSKVVVDKLQLKADSVERLLDKKTFSAALSQDLNLNPAKRVATVGTELQTRDKSVLLGMYGEVIKNLEISKMTMAQETPIIQIVDTPILPLKRQPTGKVKNTLIGGILGGGLTMLILIFVRKYKEIMVG